MLYIFIVVISVIVERCIREPALIFFYHILHYITITITIILILILILIFTLQSLSSFFFLYPYVLSFLTGLNEDSPRANFDDTHEVAKPLWSSPTIHALGDGYGLGNDFIGSIAYETNRPIVPIHGPPIAASNKRIYGPEMTADKKDIGDEYEEKKRTGALPSLGGGGGNPSLQAMLDANRTLFTSTETARRSLPDDYEDSVEMDDPKNKPLGKEYRRKKDRKEKQHLPRSRKRNAERERRLRQSSGGPGENNRSDRETETEETNEERERENPNRLYLDQEERDLMARGEWQPPSPVEGQEEDSDEMETERDGEGGYSSNPREGSRRHHKRREKGRDRDSRDRRTRHKNKEKKRVRSNNKGSESERDSVSGTASEAEFDREIREDRGSRRRRNNKDRGAGGGGASGSGPGGRATTSFDVGSPDAAVSMMQMQGTLPQPDFLAGIVEGSQELDPNAEN